MLHVQTFLQFMHPAVGFRKAVIGLFVLHACMLQQGNRKCTILYNQRLLMRNRPVHVLTCCCLQALLAVGPFCSLLQQLVAAAPALEAVQAPTLTALARFGAEFQPVEPPAAADDKDDGWSEVPRGKRQKVGFRGGGGDEGSSPCHVRGAGCKVVASCVCLVICHGTFLSDLEV